MNRLHTTQFRSTSVALLLSAAVTVVTFNCAESKTSAAKSKAASLADEVVALENSQAVRAAAKNVTLPQIARQTMAMHFGQSLCKEGSLDKYIKSLNLDRRMNKPAGVFVTLTRDGKTRGCWGTVYPQYDSVAKATAYATIGALTKEYRFAPITAHEWKKLRPQVTVVRRVEPIGSISQQDPLRDGLLVRSGGKSGVLLPGEASDAYYQMVQCKLKAGIASGESCQLYKLKVEIYD